MMGGNKLRHLLLEMHEKPAPRRRVYDGGFRGFPHNWRFLRLMQRP